MGREARLTVGTTRGGEAAGGRAGVEALDATERARKREGETEREEERGGGGVGAAGSRRTSAAVR